MFTQIENKNGLISYDNALIEQAINDSLSSFKGHFRMLKKEYFMQEDGIVISISLQLKFGTSINDFSNHVFNYISNLIENSFELPLSHISLNILGIYSKKLLKRKIEIEYDSKSGITYNDN